MRLDYKNILLKIIKAALILAGIIFFILVITSVPKDFDIRYFRGNYEATHSVKEIFALIQNNFAAFFNGDIGLVEVDGKLVKEVFKISFLRSFIVLFFSLITAIVLGLTLGYIISIISDKNTISNTLSMIPMSTPDVFTISLVQFFALYLFRNKLKFLGMGPIEHKGLSP